MHESEYTVTPLGYLIVERCDRLTAPGYDQTFASYYGVDREPYFIAPNESIRLALGEPLVEDSELHNALQIWYNMQLDRAYFFTRFNFAIELMRRFRSHAYDVELIFCHLAWSPPEKDRVINYPPFEDNAPQIGEIYGFDVSWPNCKHSAIKQPGIIAENPSWQGRLNRWGLLDTYESAVELRAAYLAVYPYPPFDVFQVSSVPDQ
jgi:hypothetical protein